MSPLKNYFKGSGKKVMKSMKKTYGAKKGKSVFYATIKKKKARAKRRKLLLTEAHSF